ncbi:DUF397 domain-containing protein [Amycolatopsis pigmentata]|uniref:DUF397 domain-containing protein n=1 Tax=Amycolatopsis pigmentata TaxID=450801 RepID=A0ABW5G304_9PSEU
MNWRKSSFSENGANCVEVADEPGPGRLVRDSKNRSGGEIPLTGDEWTEFLKAARERDFAHQPGGVNVELLADGGARMTKGKVVLTFTADEMTAFYAGVDAGEFDKHRECPNSPDGWHDYSGGRCRHCGKPE